MPEARKTHFNIQGMNCASCVAFVEKVLKNTAGVQHAEVNFADKTACIAGFAPPESVIKALKKAGYLAQEVPENVTLLPHSGHKEALWLVLRSVPALGLGVWLMANMHTSAPPLAPYEPFWFVVNWAVLLAMVLAGGHIYKKFFMSVGRLKPDMYTLIGLGTGAAWVYSCVVLYAPTFMPAAAHHFYYEAALFILAFINIGHGLEAYARGRASLAVSKLMALKPQKAMRVRNGQEQEVALDAVEVGDLLRVRPGESVPVDGVVEEGESTVNEAMVTGEPVAVYKKLGDEVIGGTQNCYGSFIMRTKHVGAATVLARIIEMVRQAQATKPALARLVDKVAGIFTVIVLCFTVIVGSLWWVYGPEPQLFYVFTVMMTMLVIACPCALGLATPVSVMAGVGCAARYGVLFPRGDALQQLGLAEVIAFDKTGTLTKGTPKVTDVVAGVGQSTERVLQVAASLGVQSSHPLSGAIVKEAAHKDITLLKATKFASHTGGGLAAKVGPQPCLLGSQSFIESQNFDTGTFTNELQSLMGEGKATVFVAQGKKVIGLLGVRDELRTEAAQAIAKLKKQGLDVVMLTGDNLKAAEVVAHRVGINTVKAHAKPEDKQNFIKALQKQGKFVAMVGDGINDAPSLAQAQVGVAIATGTDIAISTADVVIAVDDLRHIPLAVKISRATMGNIKQNIFWAFIYNSIALPVAAGAFFPVTGVLLPPWVAGGAMALSSLTVVLNALRLHWVHKP